MLKFIINMSTSDWNTKLENSWCVWFDELRLINKSIIKQLNTNFYLKLSSIQTGPDFLDHISQVSILW